ncbi:MAG TPA: LytTR family DNA-binding domain-containing protein [Candidatus Acidoferrales bacterium]|nr:LytTR family DNA-binding domain-containing protein [Candidatus Acidoferrales bacterium]
MRALIVDDERLARSGLRRLLRAHRHVEIIGEAENAEQALEAIRKLNPDLIFLDVEMPGRNGFELLEQLEDVPITIFTTAYDSYAARAFEASALDYLVKPISPERLDASLVRAGKSLRSAAADSNVAGPALRLGHSPLRQVFVRDGDHCWIVRLADISMMESEGNYTRLHFSAGSPLIFRSLTAIEQRLDTSAFFRANRSQIINLHWIEKVESEIEGRLVVKLAKGPKIEISRRQSLKLRQAMSL